MNNSQIEKIVNGLSRILVEVHLWIQHSSARRDE